MSVVWIKRLVELWSQSNLESEFNGGWRRAFETWMDRIRCGNSCMVAFFNNPEEAYTAVQSYKMHLLIPASPFLLFLIISAASPLTSASVDSQFSLALTWPGSTLTSASALLHDVITLASAGVINKVKQIFDFLTKSSFVCAVLPVVWILVLVGTTKDQRCILYNFGS